MREDRNSSPLTNTKWKRMKYLFSFEANLQPKCVIIDSRHGCNRKKGTNTKSNLLSIILKFLTLNRQEDIVELTHVVTVCCKIR